MRNNYFGRVRSGMILAGAVLGLYGCAPHVAWNPETAQHEVQNGVDEDEISATVIETAFDGIIPRLIAGNIRKNAEERRLKRLVDRNNYLEAKVGLYEDMLSTQGHDVERGARTFEDAAMPPNYGSLAQSRLDAMDRDSGINP